MAALLLLVLSVIRLSTCAEYLLPTDVTPHHYDLRVLYDIDKETNFSYYGVVDILLTVEKPTSQIVLHSQDLLIANEKLQLSGEKKHNIKDIKLNETYSFLIVTFDDNLSAHENYTLTIPFYGNLKMGLEGAYISYYTDKESGAKEYLVATQFEATSARKAFPCFDEPAHKATFSINIGHSRNFTAISNMPLLNSTEKNSMESIWPWEVIGNKFQKKQSDFVWDQFEKSVPMSTYLVAYVVSKFSYVDSPAGLSNIKFRIWSRKDAINQTIYASEIGPRVLSHFESWFGVPYPLPKLDMIAIPDFQAGAMENWGLITFRETALLYDPKHSSVLNKQVVAEVIAHELAHQWFGNLVTMKWWSDLWLNEGFATFAASVGIDAVEPEWRANLSYAVDNIINVLNLDALESSHPVSLPTDDSIRISEMFDDISYDKGSTLIRMMTMFLGENVFKTAINRYLKKYSYKNAEQDDLWVELTDASRDQNVLPEDVSVKTIMDTWTKQTGYPLLEVNRNYDDNTMTLKQKRYLAFANSNASQDVFWWLPLTIMSQGEDETQNKVTWLSNEEGTPTNEKQIKVTAAKDQWILFNYDMIAPYRINYDARNWELLTSAILSDNFGGVPLAGRVQLLTDAFALAASDKLNYSVTLRLASYLQHESELIPLQTGFNELAKIEAVIKRSSDYCVYKKYMKKLIKKNYEKVGGLEGRSHGEDLNNDDLQQADGGAGGTRVALAGGAAAEELELRERQVMISSWACRMKVSSCEKKAIKLYRSWMDMEDPDENNPIPLDIRGTVYCTALSRGSVSHWRFAVSRLRNTNVAATRDAILSSLACTREPWLLNTLLEWAISDCSDIREQDAVRMIVTVMGSSVGYYVAKDFVYNRIKEIYNAFNSGHLGPIVITMLNQFTTQKELDEFLVWKEQNSKYLKRAQLNVKQAIEKAQINIDWINKHKNNVVKLMREYIAKL